MSIYINESFKLICEDGMKCLGQMERYYINKHIIREIMDFGLNPLSVHLQKTLNFQSKIEID